MRIDLNVSKIYRYWPAFVELVGFKPWETRITTLAQQYENNVFLQRHIAEQHDTELAFMRFVLAREEQGKYPNVMEDPQFHSLLSFAAMVVQVHRRLPPPAKRKLEGQILKALNSNYGFASLRFEMDVLAGLIRQQYQVQFNDLLNGGFEYLATKRGAEIEIECKTLTVDAGRKIHRRVFVDFAGRMRPELERWQETGDGGIFLRVVIPDRLERTVKIQQSIIECVSKAISDQCVIEADGLCTVTPSRFDTAPLVENGQEDDVEEALLAAVKSIGIDPNNHVLGGWRLSNRNGIVMMVESEKPDDIIGAYRKRLKVKACDQFTKTRPASLFAAPLDLSADELLELYEADNAGTHQSFNRIASTLFERRSFLLSVAFMARNKVRHTDMRGGRHSLEGHSCYSFLSETHPMKDDARYAEIFR